jgi:hypothetical protein
MAVASDLSPEDFFQKPSATHAEQQPNARTTFSGRTIMAITRTCDGVLRRDFIKVGTLAGLGLTLPEYLRRAAAGEVKDAAKGKSAIFVYLGGGPTHMDTFDLKPEAPEDYRGEFKPIKTNVDGMEISEHLPKLAGCADKFAILRGVSHTLAAHELGTKYMITGNRPLPSIVFPGYGPATLAFRTPRSK